MGKMVGRQMSKMRKGEGSLGLKGGEGRTEMFG